MSARDRVIRPANISEEMKKKMIRAVEDTKGLESRYLRCPCCDHPIIGAYSDASGHLSGKCPKCGHTTVFGSDNAVEDVCGLESRYLKCPYCEHPVVKVYSDATGHLDGKCKKCRHITIFDVLSMRKVEPQPRKYPSYPFFWRY